MSSLPGYRLEDFVAWNLDVVILDDSLDANPSLAIAETLGTAHYCRKRLTTEQFKPIVALYEPYRLAVEQKLNVFDEECQSWRDYAGCAFDSIPELIDLKAKEIINKL